MKKVIYRKAMRKLMRSKKIPPKIFLNTSLIVSGVSLFNSFRAMREQSRGQVGLIFKFRAGVHVQALLIICEAGKNSIKIRLKELWTWNVGHA